MFRTDHIFEGCRGLRDSNISKNGQADSINSESQGAYIICDNANFAMLKSFLSVKEEYFFLFSKYKTNQFPIARPPKIRSLAKMASIIMQTKINPQTPKQCQLVNSITSNQAYISSHSPSSSSSFSGTGGSFLAKTLRSSGQVELSFSQGRMQSRSKR